MTTHRRSDAEHEKGGWQEPPKKRVRRSLKQSTCRQEPGESEESGSSASTPAGGAGGGAGAAVACTRAHSSQVQAAQEQPCVATAKCSAAVQTSSAACESSTASSCAGRGTAAAATGRVQDNNTCTTTATSATAATATHTASPTATNAAATTAIVSLHGSSCATAPTICVQLVPVSSATPHYTDAKSIASAAMPLAIPKRVWMCARKEPSASYSRIGKYAWAFAIKHPCARAVLTR